MDFGKRIRGLRKANGMTLDMLSAKSGMSKGYLSGIENGKVNPPVDRLVRKLARPEHEPERIARIAAGARGDQRKCVVIDGD